ncbi:SGT1-domain-containing protein [Martensiomyces pterosporus]|nr:SGT1-domain-containing protein [Martensiomyces pterosporus]
MHGDAVDDEWLVVWLLREATLAFPELVVSVCDADGEFLLAEAAMHIPHWLTPENSSNRVFIHNGRLHIVPLTVGANASTHEFGSEAIGLEEALSAVVDPKAATAAAAAAERDAFARLSEYPAKILQSVHRAGCRLPVKIAQALSQQPQLIAAAVELFYTRDPVQTKVLQRMEAFPPEPSLTTTVCFNRVQYAKLASQGIKPPAAFSLPPEQSPEHKASVLGMKVACGFEILSYEMTRPRVGQVLDSTTGFDEARFAELVAQLGQLGYFEGLAAGTAAYAKRLECARRHLSESERYKSGVDIEATWLVEQGSRALAKAADTRSEGSSAVDSIDGSSGTVKDEDDSWLTLHPDELDVLMRKAEAALHDNDSDNNSDSGTASPYQQQMHDRGRHAASSSRSYSADSTSIENGTARDLQKALEMFEAFLIADSGMDGVETLGNRPDHDEYVESSDEDVDLDADGIITALMDVIGTDRQDDTDKKGDIMGGSSGTNSGQQSRPASMATAASGGRNDAACKPIPENNGKLNSPLCETSQGIVTGPSAKPSVDKATAFINEDAADKKSNGGIALRDFMAAMDQELSGTNVGKSFVSQAQHGGSSNNAALYKEAVAASGGHDSGSEGNSEMESIPDVDVDLNLVENIVESFRAQQGLPGPAGTILGQFGIRLPRIDDNDNDNDNDNDSSGSDNSGSSKGAVGGAIAGCQAQGDM